MSIDSRSTKQPTQPSYTQASRTQKAAMALVAVLVSSTLLGTMLSIFDARSEEAVLGRAAAKTQPSTDGLSARRVGPGSRG